MFENDEPRRISGFKRKVLAECRGRVELHNDVLHDWYSSPNIIDRIKSRKNIWAGYA
jgi:hypothetical protein